jgi:hypothetical protein
LSSFSIRLKDERSITKPPSHIPYPNRLWPPPRIASGKFLARANSRARATSDVELRGRDDASRIFGGESPADWTRKRAGADATAQSKLGNNQSLVHGAPLETAFVSQWMCDGRLGPLPPLRPT